MLSARSAALDPSRRVAHSQERRNTSVHRTSLRKRGKTEKNEDSNLIVRADYGNAYRELYERHWWWRAREKMLLDILRTNQPVGGWRRILDVGCGDGLFFDRLLEFGDVQGVEPSGCLVNDLGKHRSRIHVGTFDAGLRLEQPFSLILMLDVLEHMPEPVRAIRYALHLLDS